MWGSSLLLLVLAGCSPDTDGDGHSARVDCADDDPAVHPGAAELCGNGIDNDCDGLVDESDSVDAATWYRDVDGDGYGDQDAPARACEQLEGHVASASDCDDDDPAVHPGATETCDTPGDDDCDGLADEVGADGCIHWYLDEDGDSYGTAASTCTCTPTGDYTALGDGDCDDSDASVHPDRDEDCATSADDDCSGTVNDVDATGCTWFYVDADRDGFGDIADPGECTCGTTPERQTTDPGDCDDTRALTHPGATETCSGHDDDCDGTVDEGDAVDAVTWYADGDGVGESVAEHFDFDADGYEDLVFTTSAENSTSSADGRVQVMYGPLTLSGSVDAVDADGTIWADGDIRYYGQGLVPAGDVDGDGYQDLWVGAEDTLGILLRGGP